MKTIDAMAKATFTLAVVCLGGNAWPTPPRGVNDGSGPFILVPPPPRPSCPTVDLTTVNTYPKNPQADKKVARVQQTGQGNGGAPALTYITTPLLPGGVIKRLETGSRVCVQPYVVNTGESASPAGATLYLTSSHPQAPVGDARLDQPLMATKFGNIPISATLPAVVARQTYLLNQVWCADAVQSASKATVLSLFLNVPTQTVNLLAGAIPTATPGVAESAALQQPPSSQNRTSVQARPKVIKFEPYTTLCKVEPPNLDWTSMPNVLTAAQAFPTNAVVRMAYPQIDLSPHQPASVPKGASVRP